MKKGTMTMLKKKYYDGFTVHDILNKHLDDGNKILELLTAFADADGVDAVKVIRCKDCKFHHDRTQCKKRIGAWFDDDYCNGAVRAERKGQ